MTKTDTCYIGHYDTAVMYMLRLLLVCGNGSIRRPINQFPPQQKELRFLLKSVILLSLLFAQSLL